MTGKTGMTRYPLETKQRAVKLHLEEELSYAEVAEQLGVAKGRIETWCYHYRHEGEASFHKPIGRPRKDEGEAVTIERLRMENALLKNSVPSCARLCSRGAISGHRTLPRKIPCEWFVCLLRDFPSSVLCLA